MRTGRVPRMILCENGPSLSALFALQWITRYHARQLEVLRAQDHHESRCRVIGAFIFGSMDTT